MVAFIDAHREALRGRADLPHGADRPLAVLHICGANAWSRGEVLGIELRLLEVARVEELATILGGLDTRRDAGLILLPTVEALAYASTLADLALEQKIPTIGAARNFADSGGLMSYGADLDDQMQRAAAYADRILKGARLGDLPVQQASRFHLVINLKTAKPSGSRSRRHCCRGRIR